MIATARIYIQKSASRKTQDDLCPVRLCVTYNRKRRYYSIKERIKNNEWLFVQPQEIHKIMTDSPRGKYRTIREEYDRIVQDAKKIINEMKAFSFGIFEDRFFNKSKSWDNLYVAMVDHIQALKSDGRFGYASSFESTLRAIKEFHSRKVFKYTNRIKVEERYKDYLSGKELLFSEINATWLRNFEKWSYKQGKARSTVGIYMRNIRVLFNLAIKEHQISVDYPFSEYRPKEASRRKLALKAHKINSRL